jgi:hypothetical protein
MIRNMLFHISVVLLIIGCGKYEDSIENPSPNNILVEVEAPQTNGWSTEEIAGTRSGITKTVKQKGEYDLNMEVSTLYYPAGYATDEAATRWANMEDNITFRVIAYKSATATEISTANYAGYGDYKLLGSSVQTTKSLILPMGTYTFIAFGLLQVIFIVPDPVCAVSALFVKEYQYFQLGYVYCIFLVGCNGAGGGTSVRCRR